MSKRTPVLALVLIVSLAISATAQTPRQEPTPAAQPSAQDDVVRVDANLIQLDVTVTDDQGRAVKGLTPEDFELLENGKPRKITSFSFVSTMAETITASRTTGGSAAPLPTVRLTHEQVRRTVALVVDNIGLSMESLVSVKQGLTKYVDSVMQPGDLVAIITTAGNIGSLQQFTSDKRLLRAAIQRLKVGPRSRGVSPFISLEGQPVYPALFRLDPMASKARLEAFREEVGGSSMLGALSTIVSGMRSLPGRKSLVVMSDGFRITAGQSNTDRLRDAMRRLTDLANRSSIVIYTMDARGLAYTGITSNDVTSGLELGPLQQQVEERRNAQTDTQRGLRELAQDTGGLTIQNTNDLGGGLQRIVADQSDYYLVGYQPDDDAFDPAQLKFINYRVKVKRSGVNVRYRSGFYGVPDRTALAAGPAAPERALANSIVSPFDSNEVQLRLTPMFGNDATGSFVRSLLHLNTKDLTFTTQPDGSHQATIDLLQVILTDDGRVANEISNTHKIQLNDELYRRSLADGFVYTSSVAIPRAGAYQMRVAVRDEATKKIGSVSQFFEVPDLTNHKLALSGLTLLGVEPAVLGTGNSVRPPADASAHARIDPLTDAARREFTPGLILQYGCIVYNASAKAGSSAALKTQTRLLRNGQVVFDSGLTDFAPAVGADLTRVSFSSALRLGAGLLPGDYVLQLLVTDPNAKGDARTTSQSIDFEIVPVQKPARS